MTRVVVALLAILAGAALGAGVARAWVVATPISPQLAVEQRLLCPQCTGTRLDVCDQAICLDMKADIRRRLAAGEPADSIVGHYRSVYGPGILAAPPEADPTFYLPWLVVAAALLALVGVFARRRPTPIPALPAVPLSRLVDEELAAWRQGGSS